MANVFVPTATPKELQQWGIGREATPGTLVNPSTGIPLSNGEPGDHVNMLMDHDLRGDMGLDYNQLLGTTIGDFPLAGDVYLDSFGHLLYNTFGEYVAVLSPAGSAAGTTNANAVVGATTLAGSAFTASLPVGTLIQVQNGTGPSEIVVLSATSTTSAYTFANTPLRFAHASTATCTSKAAGSTVAHTFRLLNGGAGATALGLPANAQPITHTLTHRNALPANSTFNNGYTGYRQYGYWCSGGLDVTMNTNNLFQHNTKGTSLLGLDNFNNVSPPNGNTLPTPTISQGTIQAAPAWEFQVAIGGTPASSGTFNSAAAINNIEDATVNIMRNLAVKYALAAQQSPVIIGRMDLSATGTLNYLAVDESPLLTMLAGTQQPLQIGMSYTQPNSGTQVGILFNFALAQFESAALGDQDMMSYNVPFRALMNAVPTYGDNPLSGGKGPMTVTLTNQTPTY